LARQLRHNREPRLGSSPGQKAAFFAYISAINHGEIDTFCGFYHPDMTLHLPTEELKGKAKIAAFYKGEVGGSSTYCG